ncbi:hypothetical protein Fcan01_14655 [Folsomia candida]|uniref:Ig-like domain-containing protein n=1 Tax=Folsomia candida TaxID=158441 RepID=A0A226E1F7_FOLCA|nr:hypothetical protein Fcan01_14655 [Folsomia candida]
MFLTFKHWKHEAVFWKKVYHFSFLVIIFSSPFWILVSANDDGVTSTNGDVVQDDVEMTTTSFIEYKNIASEQIIPQNLPPPTIRASFVESGVVKEVLSEIEGDTLVLPVDKFDLHLGQDVPTRSLRLSCNASFPVEWIYEGFGAPFHTISKSYRHITNFSDPSTYTFSVFLDLIKNDERNSGKYECKGISQNATGRTYFNLYVPGENLFLFVKSQKTELTRNSTKFVVPCPISNPRYASFIKLYKQSRIKSASKLSLFSAKENITLTFAGDRQPRIVDFEVNPASQYPFVATFEIHPTNASSEHTVITCVTTNDEVLHTWEYSTYDDVSLQKFYFDAQKRYQDARYVCCSNSYYKPKLEYTFCRSETECSMKKLTFDQDDETKDSLLGEHRDRISTLNSSCTYFNPYLKYTLPSGMLRCSVQGVNGFVSRDFMYYFNPYRIYQAYTDDKFDAGKVQASESIMKLSKTSKNALVGERQRFLCYFSELFLANGIVWRVEYNNGSSVFLDSSYDNMNSNTSFSQIEIKFNDTSVRAIHCYAPVLSSRTTWRNVTGLIFVRESPQLRASIQTESGEVLKQIEINSTTGVILDKTTLEILNNSVDGVSGSKLNTFFALDCNASYPVDFSYAGEGSPNLEYIANRVVNGSVLDANAYGYSAKLRFGEVDNQIVGRYSCISSTREFGHRNQQENILANVNVFVPGNNLFVSSDNQTYRAWEYRDSVLIPCPVTDPRPNITLLKYSNETKKFQPLENSKIPINFDPLYGFSLTKNHTSSLYGLYKCFSPEQNQSSGIIQVYLPSDAIRVTPYVKEMQILTNETQSFKCESKENVTITFSDDPTGKLKYRNITHDVDFSSHYPYIATYEAKIGDLTNLTLINCTSINESRSMHTWEMYPGDGAFIDQLIYDNVTAELKCCTQPFRVPTLEWVNCSSVTECTLKQSACLTQNKCQPGDYVLTEELDKSKVNNGCLTFDVKERPHGLLKCVVKGVHKIVAQAMVYYYDEEKDYEVHDGYFLGTKMFDKFSVPNDKIMKLTRDWPPSSQNITRGEKVRFDCAGSKFFVSSTLKWALEATNGTIYYMYGKDISNYTQVRSQLDIEFDTTTWKSIFCMAPNWKEYFGWRNVSMPLAFENSTSSSINNTQVFNLT